MRASCAAGDPTFGVRTFGALRWQLALLNMGRVCGISGKHFLEGLPLRIRFQDGAPFCRFPLDCTDVDLAEQRKADSVAVVSFPGFDELVEAAAKVVAEAALEVSSFELAGSEFGACSRHSAKHHHQSAAMAYA